MKTNVSKLIYDAAAEDLGTWEWKGAKHNPKVLAYYAEAGHPEITNDEVPWCAAFVGSVLASLGLPNTGALLARSYLKWGVPIKLNEAQRGDVVILKRGSSNWQGHVGFFHGYGAGKIEVLGGNQGNQVNISSYSANRLLGIRRAKRPSVSLKPSILEILISAFLSIFKRRQRS